VGGVRASFGELDDDFMGSEHLQQTFCGQQSGVPLATGLVLNSPVNTIPAKIFWRKRSRRVQMGWVVSDNPVTTVMSNTGLRRSRSLTVAFNGNWSSYCRNVLEEASA
jgi:hypothetical protein